MSHTDPPPPKGFGETGRLRTTTTEAWTPGRRVRDGRRRPAPDRRLCRGLVRGHRGGLRPDVRSVLVLRPPSGEEGPSRLPAGTTPGADAAVHCGQPSLRTGSRSSAPHARAERAGEAASDGAGRPRIVRMGRREVRDRANPDLGSQEVDPPAGTPGPCRRGGPVARYSPCRLWRILERPDDHAPASSGRNRAGTTSGRSRTSGTRAGTEGTWAVAPAARARRESPSESEWGWGPASIE